MGVAVDLRALLDIEPAQAEYVARGLAQIAAALTRSGEPPIDPDVVYGIASILLDFAE